MKNSPDVLTLYGEALEITDAEARKLFLDDACRDAELRGEVDTLLQAEQQAGSEFLPLPVIDPDLADVASGRTSDAMGSMIGPYKLLEKLGEGGMGVVYKAEQLEPVRRIVALKVIKAGLDSAKVVSRFEAERQALAMMDHENIARVFDGGTTPAGQPYFVMELVEGVPLTVYCDRAHVPLRTRLEMFVQLCKAIQHAHQKGVIHRDIKPSNVLVVLKEGKPVVKVIDFGVAKAISQKLTDDAQTSVLGTIIGTLEYMSPEQADTSAAGIDARSDIYSLGVLFYELLTGTTPVDRSRLKNVTFLGVLKCIREDDTPRPSTRITTSFAIAKKLAASWKVDPKKLARAITGDLDWIAMKALEKDHTRRYETASALARDIERYLNDEPVEACPPSLLYITRKFVHKHKGPVMAAAAVMLALLAGLAASTTLYFREKKALGEAVTAKTNAEISQKAADAARIAAEAARAAAVAAEEKEKRARKEAEASAEEAKTEAAKNAQTGHFMMNMLLSLNPEEAKGRDITVFKEMLDKASKDVGVSLKDNPQVEAALRMAIGSVYDNLGMYPPAQAHYEAAIAICARLKGPEHLQTLHLMRKLSLLYLAQGKLDEGEKMARKALEICKRVRGPEHEDTLNAMNVLGLAVRASGKTQEAEKLFREIMEISRRVFGPEDSITITAMANLALILQDEKGHEDEVEAMERQVLEIQKRELGPTHPQTLNMMSNLAVTLFAREKYSEADALFRETLALMKRVNGMEHPATLRTMAALANSLNAQDNFEEAETLCRESLEIQKRVLPPVHPTILDSMSLLADILERSGKQKEAKDVDRELKRLQIERRPKN